MEHLGPGNGRERSPEDLAQEIMDSSDEGMDDLLQGTEIIEGDEAESDYDSDGSPHEVGGDFESDDSDY
jgi:hypothetical protein